MRSLIVGKRPDGRCAGIAPACTMIGLTIAVGFTAPGMTQTVDTDRDGVADAQDNCPQVANAGQRDSDADGRGNQCDADLNNDGTVTQADADLMTSVMNKPASASALAAAADIDGDGRVTTKDFNRLRTQVTAAQPATQAPAVATTSTTPATPATPLVVQGAPYTLTPGTATTGAANATAPVSAPTTPAAQTVQIPAPTPVTATAAEPAVPPFWTRTTGAAKDVGVGANGTVWVIGTNAVAGGFGIYRRDGSSWTSVPGGAERIAVDPQGNAWIVDSARNIFRHDGTTWVPVSGTARDVGVGANGTVWVIGNNAVAGGYGIYRRDGESWTTVPGGAVRVSVDPQGYAWVVNATGTIFRHDGTRWVQQPGAAKDVGVGADGAIWVIGTDGGIYRYENSAWVRKPGGASEVAAGPNGIVWVVNAGNQIYQAQVAPAASGTTAPAGVVMAPIVLQGGSITVPGPGSVVSPAPTSNVAVPGTPGVTSGQISGGSQQLVVNQGATTPLDPITVSGTVPTTAYAVGPVGTSRATCGAPGTPGLCSAASASLVRNASINCPSGSFPDLGLSSCWSCPSGYTRSAAAVDTAKACQKPDSSVQGGYLSATYRGPLCPAGSFHDPIRGGECYSCPDGYRRSAAHIDAANACFVPANEVFAVATRHNNTGWAGDCASPRVWDMYDGGACWSCPDGYRRTGYAVWDGTSACVKNVGEQWAQATLVQRAQCGPGETHDLKIPGTQDVATGGGCWTCPVATDRTIHAIDTQQACERAPGLAFTAATRTAPMTCEPDEIFDPINSDNSNVSAALSARNALYPSSPITAASSGGTCWTCPSGTKRTTGAVYGSSACQPTGIMWKSAGYNQPGLFGLRGAEAVALKLVTERTLINQIIQDLVTNATADSLPANFAQVAWDEIGARPQDSFVLKMAVFSRVVAAANDRAHATADELALLDDVIGQVRRFRVFMAQDALDAYNAWKAGSAFRQNLYARSQLQVMTNVGEVPPDFEGITAGTILGSLAASGASATAIGLTISSNAVFRALFPFAVRATWRPAATAAASKVAGAAAGGLSAAVASLGPQIIVTIAIEVLAVAIEQQIDIANAEPKLRAGLATATNYQADFPRLMATPAGTVQAQGYWSNLMAGPAKRDDGSRPPASAPQNLQAFTQQAAAAKAAMARQQTPLNRT